MISFLRSWIACNVTKTTLLKEILVIHVVKFNTLMYIYMYKYMYEMFDSDPSSWPALVALLVEHLSGVQSVVGSNEATLIFHFSIASGVFLSFFPSTSLITSCMYMPRAKCIPVKVLQLLLFLISPSSSPTLDHLSCLPSHLMKQL